MKYTIHDKAIKMIEEPNFMIFKHNGLLCCASRQRSGNINGYVAVDEHHPFYGKDYSEKVVVGDINELKFNGNYIGVLCAAMQPETQAGLISIDLALDVHGGITYSRDYLHGIENDLLGKLWWFGFDTAHAGDLRPFQNDIDRKYDTSYDEDYRDYDYVRDEIIKLADQLAEYGTER